MLNLTKITTVLISTAFAVNALAASPNMHKPHCPMGKIAKLENGIWSCEDLTIKSNERGGMNMKNSPSKAKMAPKPARAKTPPKRKSKPDFQITKVQKMPGSTKFRVTVKNQGAAYGQKKAVLWVDHHIAGGGIASASVEMPQVFGSGETKYVDITFNNPTYFNRGDRMIFQVDYFKTVSETNEKNNKFYYNYK